LRIGFRDRAKSWLGSIHTDVLTTHPSKSTPQSQASANAKMPKPIQTDSQSSVIQGLGSAVVGQRAVSVVTDMVSTPHAANSSARVRTQGE